MTHRLRRLVLATIACTWPTFAWAAPIGPATATDPSTPFTDSLTDFVNTDFIDGNPVTGHNYWPGFDPVCGEAWKFTGLAGTVGFPHWGQNCNAGLLEDFISTATLPFGASSSPGAVKAEDHPKVRVHWAWQVEGVDEDATFKIISGGQTYLRITMKTDDSQPYSTGKMILYYGNNEPFVLVENVQPEMMYQVRLDIDVANRQVMLGEVEPNFPGGPEVYHTLENLPVQPTDEDGFDSLYCRYAGLTESYWDTFRVVEIPEPASIWLLALAALGRHRRRTTG